MKVIFLYFIEISKYFIALLILLYTVVSVLALFIKKVNESFFIVTFQRMIIFVLQIFLFCTLMIVGKDPVYLALLLFVETFIMLSFILMGLIYKKYNKVLLNHMCLLSSIGLCILSRMSVTKSVKQYAILVMAFGISLAIPLLVQKLEKAIKWKYFYFLLGFLPLAIVFLWGQLTYGANISFSIGGITFQPSEFVKLVFVFFLAAFLYNNQSLLNLLFTSVLAGLHVIILVLSRDLGSALIFFVCYAFVVLLCTENFLYFGGIAVGGALMSVLSYRLFDHVRVRVLAWRNPWEYIDNQGYQITQSLFAIGSGSYFGLGLTKGNPKAIPFVDTDFVFSAVCEEMGIIVGICIMLISLCAFIMMLKVALQSKDLFYQIVVFGLGIMYIFQIFLTVGGGIKFIPLTGVTLPFISYGGSSIMSSTFLFAIVQGVYIRNLSNKKPQSTVIQRSNDEENYDELYDWIEKQGRKRIQERQ